MLALAMLYWIGINLNNEKSLFKILNQILNRIYLQTQNSSIQPGVFLTKMRGRVRYVRSN